MFFCFLDLFAGAEELLDTVPAAAMPGMWREPAVTARLCLAGVGMWSSLGGPSLRLLQRAPAEAGVLSDAGPWVLCPVLLLMQNLACHWVSGNFRESVQQ